MKIKMPTSLPALSSIVIAIVTGLWVYVISDNPIKVVLSAIIGLSCGIVCFFIMSRQNVSVTVRNGNVPTKRVLVILFVLFLSSFLFAPVNSVFMANWFNVPLLNWLSLVLSFVFAMFVPGFLLLHLIHAYQKMPLTVNIVLSILVSMFFTAFFWFIIKSLSLSDILSFGLFSLAQFIVLMLYFMKTKQSHSAATKQTRILRLNVIIPLLAIACIFVSLIVLQEFVYQPFVRGDSWDYVSTSAAITKGAFNLIPAGKFYALNSPNFFETFLSGLVGFSGFPPVNSLLILSLVVAVLLPVAFYSMAVKFTRNHKVGLLSTLLFVVASGFGWIPFISEKLVSGVSYSADGLVYAVDNLAPKVLYDITQPQGVLSEGLKTYAFGVLAIIMLLYLFESELKLGARIPLIAVLVSFAFLFHVEEAIVFALAFVPVYLIVTIFSKAERRNIRFNLGGVACGLLLGSLVGFVSGHGNVAGSVSIGIVSSIAMGVFFALTYVKIKSLGNYLRESMEKSKLGIFLAIFYLMVLSVIILVFYGYSGMSSVLSIGIVFQGLPFPWYYYPMSLGIVGILVLIGLLSGFKRAHDLKITSLMLMVISLMVFGFLLSWFNSNVFLTGTKEWRVIYRMIPIPASVFAGWVLYRFVELKDRRFVIRIFSRRWSSKFNVNTRPFVPVVLLLVIILGTPSTVLASEYWMATGLNPNGDIHPGNADVELANLFYHLPLTDRTAVFTAGLNALVRLGGDTTAMPATYPSLTNSTRPETVALLSSDIRYLVLDTASGSIESFPLLSYLQVVFNNSKYIVYQLPYLQSPTSESTIGYAAPIAYDNSSLLSFMLISSLNLSYQIVNFDFYNKSMLILPKDLSGTAEGYSGKSVDSTDLSVMLNWVNGGGDLVVFGENGVFFQTFGITVDVENYSTVNSVRIGSTVYGLNDIVNVNRWSFDSEKIRVLSYYQFDGNDVNPFAVEIQRGNGSIIYFNVDPLYIAANKSFDTRFYSDISSIINGSLNNLGLNLSQTNVESVPISDRWLSKYQSYAKNNFFAIGDINIESNDSGSSYLLANETVINTLSLNQVEVQNSSMPLLYNITVEGQASVMIRGSQLASSSGEALIPNYYFFQVENCSLDIKSVNAGSLKISTDKGTFVVDEASFTANNASFIIHSPSVDVNGTVHFDKVSLPSVGSIWSNNVDLQGRIKFNLAYGDNQYVFFDNVSYPSWLPSTPEIVIIPLKDILFSPWNITFLMLLCFLYFASRKRFFRVSEVIA